MNKKKAHGHLVPGPPSPLTPEPMLIGMQFSQPIVNGVYGMSEIQPSAAARCKPFCSAPKARPLKV